MNRGGAEAQRTRRKIKRGKRNCMYSNISIIRLCLLLCAVSASLRLCGSICSAQDQAQPRRPNNRPAQAPATAVGQIITYEPEKSLAVEIKIRGGKARQQEFVIATDHTKIELLGDAKALAVGMPVS